jgi:hypothetical protein
MSLSIDLDKMNGNFTPSYNILVQEDSIVSNGMDSVDNAMK